MTRKLLPLLALCLSFSYYSFAQCTAEILQAGPFLVCQFSNTTLNATPGGMDYQWQANGVDIPGANAETYDVPTDVTGTFTYTVEIIFNTCTDISDSLTLVVNPTPQPVAVSNSPVCDGQNVNLQMSLIVPLMGVTYSWMGPGGFTSTIPNPSFPSQSLSAGTYTLVVATNGCSASATTFVIVSPTPVISSASSNSPVCAGNTLELTANVTPGVTYHWTGPNGWYNTTSPPSIPNATPLNSGTYTLVVTASGCASAPATTNVVVNPTPVISVTYTDPTYPNTNDGSITISGLIPFQPYTISFTADGVPQTIVGTPGGGSFTISNLSEGIYSDIIVTYNGCTSNTAGPYTLVGQNPLPGYVWPGDVNDDNYADNNDVLDLGLSYGQTGTARINPSINWQGENSVDWAVLQVNGADMKHADCDGNGMVDATDVDAVNLNYGQWHPKGFHLPQAKSASLPDLYFDLTGITFQAGTTVNIPIKLGTSSMQMYDVLGIAAKIKVTNVTLNNAPTISNATSWLGNSGNTINFTKEVSANQTDWAYVRTDHTNASGEGTIAILTMEIPADAPAQDAVLYFDDVKIINSIGDVLTDYNVVDDTATIVPVSIRSTVSTTSDKATIVPNPSDAQADLQITLSEPSDVQVTITDMTGRKVWSHSMSAIKGQQSVPLPSAQLASGVYHILISTDRANIAPIKWIKK